MRLIIKIDMKKVLIASGIAVLAFTMIAGAQGYAFSNNLTVGSTGQDVVALQTWLVANNYLTMPGGVAMGYFGSLTKSGVARYQVAAGIVNPGTGFVGPLTRAKLNAGSTVATGGTTCPTGYTCTANNAPVIQCPSGYTCTANQGTTAPITGSTGITTPGVPGLMSVTTGPLSSSVLNVGQQMTPVFTIRVQAQYSDLAVQNVTLDLGNNTAIFNKIFNKVYVMDGSTVVASQSLNGSTVVQSGNQYIVGVAGFNVIVPKGTYKDLTIAADLNSSIDSTYLAGGVHYPSGAPLATMNSIGDTPVAGWGIGLDANSLRAVDGAGLNLYNTNTLTPQTLVINSSLVDNALANISIDGASPTTNVVPVSNTATGNISRVPVLVFDVNAQSDTLHLHNVSVRINAAAGVTTTGTTSAAYLLNGSTLVSSASISGGVATFSNITDGTAGASIPVNTTVPFTVAIDASGVTAGTLLVSASVDTTNTTVYNSQDSTVSLVGSVTGNTITIAGNGPIFTLSSAPSIATQGTNNAGTQNLSTSTIIASFNLNIGAIGADINFGTTGSSSPAFLFDVIGNNGSVIYSGYGQGNATGVLSNTGNLNNPTVVLPTLSTQFTNGAWTNSFRVANGQTTPLPLGTVTFQFDGKDQTGAVLTSNKPYKVTLAGIRYVTTAGVATSTFMNLQTSWTTGTINP